MGKMMSMLGQDPADMLTPEQVGKILRATFDKFDKDQSGVLENEEFHKAWGFLKLKGSRTEVDRAFQDVDSDGSGRIDIEEFMRAIKGSRMAELSLSVIV